MSYRPGLAERSLVKVRLFFQVNTVKMFFPILDNDFKFRSNYFDNFQLRWYERSVDINVD